MIKKINVYLDRKGNMNTVIHDIAYEANHNLYICNTIKTYHKFKTCSCAYTKSLSLFKCKMITNLDL